MAGVSGELAWLSGLVYEPWDVVSAGLRQVNYKFVEYWDHRATQGMLAAGPTFDAIVFRGTEASDFRIRDIFANLAWPWPVPWQGVGRAHSGYTDAFTYVSYDAINMARKVATEKPLYFTGHSMGGALATMAASMYYYKYPNWNLAGLVTFGAPKALDKTACQMIKCVTYRYVMPCDFAPHWPPVLWLTHPAPARRLTPPQGWPGPITRHNIAGYNKALGGRELP